MINQSLAQSSKPCTIIKAPYREWPEMAIYDIAFTKVLPGWHVVHTDDEAMEYFPFQASKVSGQLKHRVRVGA